MGEPALAIIDEVAGEEAVSQIVRLTVIEGGATAAGDVLAGGAGALGIGGAAVATAGVALVVVGLAALAYYLLKQKAPLPPELVSPCRHVPEARLSAVALGPSTTAGEADASSRPIPCFEMPEKGSPEEMERQLKEQEDKINGMSPDKILENMKIREEMKRLGGKGRPTGDAAARVAARAKAFEARQLDLYEYYLSTDMDPAEADDRATSEATDWIKTQDATHALDFIAGGDGEILGTGGAAENRSIGPQWNSRGGGETKTRAELLKEAAEDAKKHGRKMKITLKMC